ncbi:MAG: P1 family peptidase [Solirubrobacteraceae bacterium]
MTARSRELGIVFGDAAPGPLDAITDVAGVRVGSVTLIEGEDVRTGVTVIVPSEADVGEEQLFAGCHTLNGNGELTGLEWVRESGRLTTPIAITNTHSVGVVRDALVAASVRARGDDDRLYWALPVVGETYDGMLNDINGMHVRGVHLDEALAKASGGPVEEGAVGGGTGMICHGFKGGIGTASRMTEARHGGFTVGVLVQANHGWRERLTVAGAPVGRVIGHDVVPDPHEDLPESAAGAGSIIVVVATDAPLLPHQCRRLAQRASLGIARTGGAGAHSSGDILIAFSAAQQGLPPSDAENADEPVTVPITMFVDSHINHLYHATIEATEAAIVNALLAAGTMTGRRGVTAYGLEPELLLEAMGRFGPPS